MKNFFIEKHFIQKYFNLNLILLQISFIHCFKYYYDF